MAKAKARAYFCKECGYEHSQWLGRCPICGAWNSMVEEPKRPEAGGKGGVLRDLWYSEAGQQGQLQDLDEVRAEGAPRVSSGNGELDRVLGGGFVPGSVLLLGGDPGIGKSTLLLQVAATQAFQGPLLYVSGEESPQQIKLRAERLGIRGIGLKLLPEVSFERIAEVIQKLKPAFCVIDSIQTLYSESLQSAAGSVTQVREVTGGLVRLAKALGCTIVLVGHVTKEGSIAGPRVLEHMVDTVLYFEGDSAALVRMVRAVKNRFGAAGELGFFEMTQEGLQPLEDASGYLLAQRPEAVFGAAVGACLEGSRAILSEVQALVLPAVYGQPQRTVQGLERTRLQMILAVMENHLGYPFASHDVYVNAVGGLKLQDPAMDLTLAAALASAQTQRVLDPRSILIGEIGLTGELRQVAALDRRIAEALRMGYTRCVIPGAAARNLRRIPELRERQEALVYVDSLREALDVAFTEGSGRMEGRG